MSLGGAAGAAASVGGGLMSFFGADQKSDQDAANYQLKAQDALFSAGTARRSAQYVKELLPLTLQRQQRDFDKQLGTIRANYGASGLDMAGTPLEVLKVTARDQAMEQELTKFGAKVQIQSYRDQARQLERSADIYNANAADAQKGDFMSMLSAAFGTGSSLLGNSYIRTSFGIK